MQTVQEGVEYKWLDIADRSFGEVHDLLERLGREGWQLDAVVGPEQLPETALYGNAGALQLWLRRVPPRPLRRRAA
jgi:hypothetical protein